MDHDEMPELDELLARTRVSALASLTEHIDVEHHLEIIRRACTADQDEKAAAPTTTPP
ncbi:hypothetical protein [Winogradskya humida]|uniref:FCD domain-containing protein n=1 Tax=Winogradskya humida TaxID=113566 RepID=A0ABQ3ZLV8_9ACTN|nr:hypothetical protein [Actinoplanes humidus]GIE19493.1 hypothetical protein Ahu01nite_025950 [Actinoplanes humidus]